ncbi:MAG TPA: sigma-70 family RNA polymerase sigma factor [Planctomycetota bacterium]|nr:sigma-70 family RNA polymerase sigma factor [Planctomycetota bacterium]
MSARLLREVQAGTPGAWEQLVARYERLVLAVPREMGLSEADAEEVFQATWIALFEQVALIRQPSALGSWIITTAQRQVWRVQRRALRRREHASLEEAANAPAPLPAPEEQAERLERERLVREALDELRPRCRELLNRLFLSPSPPGEPGSRASYADIARDLGMPIGSIGPTRLRCLQELARILAGRLEP